MNLSRLCKCAISAAIVFLPLPLFAATEIHISPIGNDANRGTAVQPVATPQRAQELVHGKITAGLTGKVDGIFAFRNQGGNVVEYNHIHNAMQTTINGGCIHFATMNRLAAPNFILNNWLHDILGNERKPGGTVNRRLGNGVFLDWDTSNTTVKDNWIFNSVGGAVEVGKFRFKAGQKATVTLSSAGPTASSSLIPWPL